MEGTKEGSGEDTKDGPYQFYGGWRDGKERNKERPYRRMDGMLNKDGWHVTYRSVGTFIILPYYLKDRNYSTDLSNGIYRAMIYNPLHSPVLRIVGAAALRIVGLQ